MPYCEDVHCALQGHKLYIGKLLLNREGEKGGGSSDPLQAMLCIVISKPCHCWSLIILCTVRSP